MDIRSELGFFTRTHNLPLLSIIHMIFHIYLLMHIAILPTLMQEFGINDYFWISIFVTVPYLFQSIATFAGGFLADRFEYKTLITVTLIIECIAGVMVIFANNIYVLGIAISLLTSASALYHPVSYSLLSVMIPEQNRGKAMGLHGGFGALGFAIGPISIGLLMGLMNWRYVYVIWVIPIILTIILVQRMKNIERAKYSFNEEKEEVNEKRVMNPQFIIFLVLLIFLFMGEQIFIVFLSPYLVSVRNMPQSLSSTIVGLASGLGFIAAPVGGYLSDTIGSRKWLAIAIIGVIIGVVGIYYTPTMLLVIPIILLYSFFSSSTMGTNTAIVSRLTPRKYRGKGYGIFFIQFYLSSALILPISGYVAQNYELTNVFPIAILMMLVSLVLIFKLDPKQVNNQKEKTS